MASIIKASINLTNVPKDRIIVGKKGKYLPITITVNDETFGSMIRNFICCLLNFTASHQILVCELYGWYEIGMKWEEQK